MRSPWSMRASAFLAAAVLVGAAVALAGAAVAPAGAAPAASGKNAEPKATNRAEPKTTNRAEPKSVTPAPLSRAEREADSTAARSKEHEVNLTIRGSHGDPMDLIRERLHPTTAHVPAFPHPANLPNPDTQLMVPSHWPETLTLNGVRLVRKIHAWSGPMGQNLRTLRERKKHTRVVMSYNVPGTGVSAGWGPRYSWDEKDRLTERIWFEPDPDRLITHDYTYYKDGRLLGYSWRSGPRRADNDTTETEYLSEFYDRGGKLIAIGYERRLGEANISHYVWDGHTVGFDDFRMKSHALYATSR